MSIATTEATAPANFAELGLIPPLLARLTELRISAANAHSSAQAIPSVLAGRDLIAGANTGSGKTATLLHYRYCKKHRRSNCYQQQHAEKSLSD